MKYVHVLVRTYQVGVNTTLRCESQKRLIGESVSLQFMNGKLQSKAAQFKENLKGKQKTVRSRTRVSSDYYFLID